MAGRVGEVARDEAGETGRGPQFLAPQSVTHRPAALASAGSLSDMQNFRPDSRFTLPQGV